MEQQVKPPLPPFDTPMDNQDSSPPPADTTANPGPRAPANDSATQMTKEGMDEPPFATEECSPLNQTYDPNTNDPKRKSVQSWYARMSIEKRAEYNAKRRISRQQRKVAALDCASDTCVTSTAPICVNTPQTHASAGASANKQGGKGWYANLSDEKKAEHLRKLRMAREQKRSAAQQIGASANKQGMVQHTPLGDITNTHTKGTCATSTAPISANTPQTNVLDTCATSTAPISANTPQTHASAGGSANKQGGKGWYATVSDEKKAEHLRNLRMAREQKRSAAPVLDVDVLQSSTRKDQYGSAQSGITRILGTPTGGTNMEEDGSTDWLHTNPTYKRKVRLTDHVAEMDGQDNFHTPSFIFGGSIEPLDASYEKERLRKRTKYLNMDATQKDVMLSRNRAYKKRKRDTNTLFDQNDIADAISGTTDQSSRASAIKMHPSYTNFHRGGCNNEEDSDAHGIFEPMGQTCETEECADTIEEEQTLYDDDGDDECRLYSAQGNEFESYRVMPDGSHAFETHDPYDYVYNNLPTKHHVLKPVKDCVHCGAMRFQYEGPAFCCRKALGVLPLVGSTLDVYLDDHITKLETMRIFSKLEQSSTHQDQNQLK